VPKAESYKVGKLRNVADWTAVDGNGDENTDIDFRLYKGVKSTDKVWLNPYRKSWLTLLGSQNIIQHQLDGFHSRFRKTSKTELQGEGRLHMSFHSHPCCEDQET
jgi:hypothetical protein